MKAPPHIVSLYYKTARRYKKLISKIQRGPTSSYHRKTLVHQLRKLAKKLRDLQVQLKIAVATGAVVLVLNASPANAQVQLPGPSSLGPFVRQDRAGNPLREPIFNSQDPALTVIDFDEDGDLDVVMGEADYSYGGYLRYFENKSSEGILLYEEVLRSENPFDGIHATTGRVAPAFADIDKDGDMDLFLGQNGGYIYNQTSSRGIEYYRNDGGNLTKQTGTWDSQTKEGNPFEGVVLGYDVRPVFIDFDKDGDQDVIIGSYVSTGPPTYNTQSIHYYNNDGAGNFTSSPVSLVTSIPSWVTLSPALADLDSDGDYDMIAGTYYGDQIAFIEQVTPGNFVQQSGPWDPVAKTGNPFDGFRIGANPSPVFIDFNDDGNPDLFLADASGYRKYSDNIINYYKNSGNSIYEEVNGFENPFDGVYAKAYASPTLLDLDADGELDAVIGNKYSGSHWDYELQQYVSAYSSLAAYKKNETGTYTEVKDEESAFSDMEITGYLAPRFADVDGDADLDIISGGDYGQVNFFRNDEGVYVHEVQLSPFANVNVVDNAGAHPVDIDNDGDLDLFMTNGYGEIRFFRNTGTSVAPAFTEEIDANNPLSAAAGLTLTPWTTFLSFTDIDHDGDLDVLFQGRGGYQRAGEVLYFENTGTKKSAVFANPLAGLFTDIDDINPQMEFVDYDGDGDLDAFAGSSDGTVMYLENQNEIVTTTVTGTVDLYAFGGTPVIVEPNLALSDPDQDDIVQATVSIDDFQPGETLSFTPQAGITGAFDATTGVLTFRGKATLAEYQSLLRTVTFEIIEDEGGRKRPAKKVTTARTISFAIYDIDFTNPEIVPKTLNVFVNTPPEIAPEMATIPGGSSVLINLLNITTDIDDNLNPNLFTIVKAPTSGAVATIQPISATEVYLKLDYSGVVFKGTDQLTIQACDALAACSESVLSVEVNVGDVTVYNAIAPNSGGDNKFMRIHGLPEGNKVNIYNRWGDRVFEATNYQDANAFKGLNSSGNSLPSGTYYYTIEIPGMKTITGYLTLKQ